MFGFFSRKKVNELEKKTQDGFISVRKDMDSIGKWIKHLDMQNKQLFDLIYSLRADFSELNDEIESLREGLDLATTEVETKQLFKKLPVLPKQTAVEDIQESVQTAVQTDNIHGILKKLSGNERILVLALMQSDLKLSYEDLALLLGKERSTIRGQINSIKQKIEGLISEISEKNGKKRVFIPDDIKQKMEKYAKVRMGKK